MASDRQGTNKPCNVAAALGVLTAHGVEVEKLRVQKALCVLLALLEDTELGARHMNVSVVNEDITNAKSFGSNTHIYAFSTGEYSSILFVAVRSSLQLIQCALGRFPAKGFKPFGEYVESK